MRFNSTNDHNSEKELHSESQESFNQIKFI